MIFLFFILFSITENLKITGKKSIFYEERFYSGNYPTGFIPYSLRHEHLVLRIKGILRWKTEITGEIMQNSNPLEKEHVFLNLKNPFFRIVFGDQRISFKDNILLFSRTYNEGVKGEIFYEGFEGEFIYTKTKGNNFYERIKGNNTQGPFYLGSAPVVSGSEEIFLIKDGKRTKLKRGLDYDIDYFSGTVSFLKRIVKEDEIIEVFFQSRDERTTQIFGFRTFFKYIGYSEINSVKGKEKRGNWGIDLKIPFRFFVFSFYGAFNKYSSTKPGAYGTRIKSKIKDVEFKGYYRKYESFYSPVENLYFHKRGKEDSVEFSFKDVFFKRYTMCNDYTDERNYVLGLDKKYFSYSFSENFLLEDNMLKRRSVNSFTLKWNMKKARFRTGFIWGKERNPYLFEGNKKIKGFNIGLSFREKFIITEMDYSKKMANGYVEENLISNVSGSFKRLKLMLSSEYFDNSNSPYVLIFKGNFIFNPNDVFKNTASFKREYRFLSDSLGKGKVDFIFSRFDFDFKKFFISPFMSLKEIKTPFYYFNYILKGSDFRFIIFKDIKGTYSISEGKGKNIRRFRNLFALSKHFISATFHYNYMFFLTRGSGYFDTFKINVQRVNKHKIEIEHFGNLSKIKSFVEISDSLWSTDDYHIDFNCVTIGSEISKDVKKYITIFSGLKGSYKKGINNIIGEGFLKFYTIAPSFGAIGKYKEILVIEGKLKNELSLNKDINYGRREAILNLSFDYKFFALYITFNYKKYISFPYEDFKINFKGEVLF